MSCCNEMAVFLPFSDANEETLHFRDIAMVLYRRAGASRITHARHSADAAIFS